MKKLSVDLEVNLSELIGIDVPTLKTLRQRQREIRDAQGCQVNLFIMCTRVQILMVEQINGFIWVSQYATGRARQNEYGACENFRFLIEERRKYSGENDRRTGNGQEKTPPRPQRERYQETRT